LSNSLRCDYYTVSGFGEREDIKKGRGLFKALENAFIWEEKKEMAERQRQAHRQDTAVGRK
jgi:hypothetical protein